MRRMAAAALLAAVLAMAPGMTRAAQLAACPPASSDDADVAPLPHVSGVLKRGGLLDILAVGSATVFGPATAPGAEAASQPANAPPLQPNQTGFPWQAARALQAAVPGLQVNVTVVGKRGMSAADMLVLLRQELPRKPYRLVLWQTGTVEAVDELPPDDFYQTLSDGADVVAAAGADLVLIDPQYSRFLAANANLEPYFAALQAAAALPGVGLFHRFDLMRDWAGGGAIDLERAAKSERQATAVRLHACLGRALAHALLAAAQ